MNEAAIEVIERHVPSLSTTDEIELDERRYNSDVDRYGQPAVDVADLALRTCSCGVGIDGFYAYVDHILGLLGKESHLAG